jgi:hypothetical protein
MFDRKYPPVHIDAIKYFMENNYLLIIVSSQNSRVANILCMKGMLCVFVCHKQRPFITKTYVIF